MTSYLITEEGWVATKWENRGSETCWVLTPRHGKILRVHLYRHGNFRGRSSGWGRGGGVLRVGSPPPPFWGIPKLHKEEKTFVLKILQHSYEGTGIVPRTYMDTTSAFSYLIFERLVKHRPAYQVSLSDSS